MPSTTTRDMVYKMLGKHKGNRFENLIFRDLDSKGLPVRKTLGSGSPEDQAGDLLLWANKIKYAIECKHHKSFRWKELNQYFDKLKREIYPIAKNMKDAVDGMKRNIEPILIFRENRQPIMVMTVANVNGKTMRCIVSYNLWKQTLKR